MKPNEFMPFNKETPKPKRHLIVTNNLNAKNAYGEMSHVWLTTFWTPSKKEGIVTFDCADRKIINLTHWKYA